ncbi:MAG: LysM peptidoglycan-binding domain-containing protein [Chitinophagaceae bacterium]|nr:LysM peptidoglycan-binding domain-containing protein [Chitinophagaceae bacterium]
MSLQNKYQELINAVKQKASGDVRVVEQDDVLYIDGQVGSEQDKDALWEVYNSIDPDYRAGDLRLNLEVTGGAQYEEYVVKSGDSLSKIGAKYGIAWKTIFEANKDIIKNPDLIQPGWKLKIPAK